MQKIIVVVGPTASNKTKLSIELAQTYSGEIINADAFQVYSELNIGVNRPSKEELSQAAFHLTGNISINEKWDIKRFQDESKKIIQDIYARKKIPIVVGGSHLYIDALIYNYDLSKSIERNETFNELTNEELFDRLKILNNELANKIGRNNKKRLVRALQIITSGQIMNSKNPPIYDVICICCTKPRDVLYKDIDERVDWMIAHGWFEEVDYVIKKFPSFRSLNAFKAIGYLTIAEGLSNPEQGIDIAKIKQQTRQYAKRQLTWIRHHYANMHIFNQNNWHEIKDAVQQWIKN